MSLNVRNVVSHNFVKLTLIFCLIPLLALIMSCKENAIPLGKIVTDTITSDALKDNVLGDPNTRNITIYLPPNYSLCKKRYPVIYLLHGYGGNNHSYVDAVGETGAILLLDGLIKTGILKEVIIVMPDGKTKYGGSYYQNSELTGKYEDYIINEIVNYVDGKYRTIKDRSGRAIAGASMGGYGSITLAMKHPDAFVAVASLSPPLGLDTISEAIIPQILKENPNGIGGPIPDSKRKYTSYIYALSAVLSPNLNNPPFLLDLPFEYPGGKVIESIRQKWLIGDPMAMLSTYSSSFKNLKGNIYIDVGNEDLLGFTAAAYAFHDKLNNMGIEHKFNVYLGGHTDQIVARMLDSLTFISMRLVNPSKS